MANNNNDKNSEFLNNSIERKHRTSNYESNKNPKENDLEFERKYIQNSLKKSPIFERTSIGFEGSFQRENWRKIEDFIEPLSPPKLLYFNEEKVIGFDEENEDKPQIMRKSEKIIQEEPQELKKPERICNIYRNIRNFIRDLSDWRV